MDIINRLVLRLQKLSVRIKCRVSGFKWRISLKKKTMIDLIRKIMKSKFIFLLACFLLLVLVTLSNAQPPDLMPAPSQAPIDGGLSVLLISGGAYALKKLKANKND